MTVNFMFNANTKEFIGISQDSALLTDGIIYRTENIPDDKVFDYSWVGNYDTGKLVNIGEDGYGGELQLREEFINNFYSKYPMEEVLFDILETIDLMDIEKTPKLQETIKMYKKYLNKYNMKLQYFRGEPV